MDLQVLETGNGGDVNKKGKDLAVIYGFQNMPYLAMFGGNVLSSTPNKRLPTQQAFDWWGNSLLLNDTGHQMNSETERVLMTTPLTSAGRLKIEQAVKKDLSFMKEFAEVTSDVSIIDTDVVEISVKMREPNNLQSREFLYIWDASEQELEVIADSEALAIGSDSGFFDDSFNDTFA